MNTCPKCGLVKGLHGSVLPGCTCWDAYPQHAETAPQQRHWVGLTNEETERLIHNFGADPHTLLDEVDAKLKARNT